MLIRRSTVTGQRRLDGWFASRMIDIYDGAQYLPVIPRDDSRSMVAMQRGDQYWQTFVCTGPAAPLPARPLHQWPPLMETYPGSGIYE